MRALVVLVALVLALLVADSALANGKKWRSSPRVTHVKPVYKQQMHVYRIPYACSAVKFPRSPLCELRWEDRYKPSPYWF
jgi:hypothetical protein